MAAKLKKPAAKKKPSPDDEVAAFLSDLDHPLKTDIEAVRKLVLGTSATIAEGIKWNSISFRRADWFATVNLRSKDVIQLVFHIGAKVKDNPDLKIADTNGLLLWLAKDRALVTLGSGKTLKANAKAFEAIVKAWLKYV
ncbi:MAG: DUF1801 domain-containing protein [Hyphomonadaceae bacterium]|nr:DUF1801 domain-containing protein [Hyphomonadaceae bacterium]